MTAKKQIDSRTESILAATASLERSLDAIVDKYSQVFTTANAERYSPLSEGERAARIIAREKGWTIWKTGPDHEPKWFWAVEYEIGGRPTVQLVKWACTKKGSYRGVLTLREQLDEEYQEAMRQFLVDIALPRQTARLQPRLA